MSKEKIFQFQIVTPEKIVFSDSAEAVSLPTAVGEITVLPGHESLIGIVEDGEIKIKKDGREYFLAVAGGFLEMENNLLRVFADFAERTEDLDLGAIERAKEEAEKALSEKELISERAFADAEARLKRELLKLRIFKKRRR
jgi:F-type H+-transporting ATPase subunit epsilon